jgi:hypothetical protein
METVSWEAAVKINMATTITRPQPNGFLLWEFLRNKLYSNQSRTLEEEQVSLRLFT